MTAEQAINSIAHPEVRARLQEEREANLKNPEGIMEEDQYDDYRAFILRGINWSKTIYGGKYWNEVLLKHGDLTKWKPKEAPNPEQQTNTLHPDHPDFMRMVVHSMD